MEEKNKLLLDASKLLYDLAEITKLLASLFEDTKELKKELVKLEDVRRVLAEKSKLGKSEEIKVLIEKYGGTKLSDINPNDYENLMKEAEVI